ncbi:choice-of-anchor B family protein [Sanyastnella coralliicola]|uniref:choice-of-anchor B family protein n=1 Tax=Sanyastnella coralliicola TaxID=3069118 RepID=UPI0027BA5348|nr:choice-of-anchor B family protein [Longitalea sp. SCSIO 12813]
MKRFLLAALSCAFLTTASAQTPCVDGEADGYPCLNTSLWSVMDLADLGGGQNGNDCWGWVSPDGREFALMGKDNGTAFVEISDPANPVLIGTLATHTTNSLWRDIKVYENHAYIVSEAPGHGMQVFNLMQLTSAVDIPVIFEATAHYDSFGNSHNIVINEETGYAYAVGTSTFGGGLHIVDISDPLNPQLVGEFAEDGYTHDAQVVIYDGPDGAYSGKEIAFAYNEDNIAIVDVTDKSDCQLISSVSYDLIGYTHQGWLTEDHRFMLVDDELDESDYDINTRTYIYNVEDLSNPIELGWFESDIESADHNQYTLNGLSYQSNYMGGLRVLDLSDVANGNLEEVAYFDTNPESNGNFFWGSWSNYPYLPSQNIIVSTFSHMFVIRLENIVSASSIDPTAELTVYPNPASDQMSIEWEGGKLESLSLINALGQTVRTLPELNAASGRMTIELGDLPSGMYILQNASGSITQRVIKQ